MKTVPIRALQQFANEYFKRGKPPTVMWKKNLGNLAVGLSEFKTNRIYLDPTMSQQSKGCMVGVDSSYKAAIQFKLVEGEHYFLVLLHEIYHFKLDKHYKVPNYYKELKRQIEEDTPESLRRDVKRRIDWRANAIWDYVQEKDDESEGEYIWRVEDVRSYILIGYTNSQHIAVEDKARIEFRKRRKEIRTLLAANSPYWNRPRREGKK